MVRSINDISNLGEEIFYGLESEIRITSEVKSRINSKVSISKGSRISRISNDLRGSPEGLTDIIRAALREAISSYQLIDTGRLINSGEVIFNGSQIEIRYDVPYANLIHYGGYIVPYGNRSARPVYIAPRPWVSDVLDGRYTSSSLREIYRQIILSILKSYN